MLDRNGIEIRTGDVVRIDGAYFATDNGLYFVEHSPGDPTWCGSDHSLLKMGKRGKISKTKYNVGFWPILTTVSDRFKAAKAHDWNKSHATIEVIRDMDRSEIKAFFSDKVAGMDEGLKREKWIYGEDSDVYKKDVVIRNFYESVAAGIN